MSKNDQQKGQQAIDTRGQDSINGQNTLRNNLQGQNSTFNNNYNNAVTEDTNTRQGLQGNYSQALQGIRDNNASIDGRFDDAYKGYQDVYSGASTGGGGAPDMSEALAGYRNFANTGGFSNNDLSSLRARAISPTRAVYANAQSNIDRQRSLQGGYSPNYTAASAKLSRDESQSASDANVNANASIAQAVQQGKLAGLTGLSTTQLAAASLGLQGSQLSNNTRLSALGGMTGIDQSKLSGQFTGRNQELAAIGGAKDLYGTAPGLSGTYGNQLLTSDNQLLGEQNSRNSLNLGLINAQQNNARIPGNFDTALGRVGSIMGLAQQGGKILSGLPGLGNGSPSTSSGSSPSTGSGLGSPTGNSGTAPGAGQDIGNYQQPYPGYDGSYPGPQDPSYPSIDYPGYQDPSQQGPIGGGAGYGDPGTSPENGFYPGDDGTSGDSWAAGSTGVNPNVQGLGSPTISSTSAPSQSAVQSPSAINPYVQSAYAGQQVDPYANLGLNSNPYQSMVSNPFQRTSGNPFQKRLA